MTKRRALALIGAAGAALVAAGCQSGGGPDAGVAQARPAAAYAAARLPREHAAP
jgi:hypothetical protein